MKRIELIILLLFCVNLSWASDSTKVEKHYPFLAVNIQNGFMLSNGNFTIENGLKNNYFGADIRYGWQRHKPNYWDRLYRYPSFGIGFYTADLSGVSIEVDGEQINQGYPNALYGFWSVPINRGKKWQWQYQLGLGLSYNFVPYDSEGNPYNLIIGSNQNVYVDLGIGVNYVNFKRFDVGLELNYKHFSNGSYQLPNSGINLISANLLIRYNMKKERPDFDMEVEIPEFERKWSYDTYLAYGAKQLETDGQRYPNFTFSNTAFYGLNWKRKIGVGLDLFYFGYGNDLAQQEDEENGVPYRGDQFKNNFSVGAKVAYEMVYDRLSIPLSVGYYLFKDVYNDDAGEIYLRAGVKYYYFKDLYAAVSIKAHGGRADYVEYTLGYTVGR